MVKVRTQDLLDNFTFTLMAGESGLHREIVTSDISRPGIELTGHFKYYPKERLQLIGKTEMAYFLDLDEENQRIRSEKLCTDVTPGIIITREMKVPKTIIDAANDAGVPILQSPHKTTRVISRLTNYLEIKFAPATTVHGVLIDIYGIGVLITGQSGIGKSETALELIKRGHRLVADDNVEIYQQDYDYLIGRSPQLIEHLLEIRGLGIIDILTLFGVGSVIKEKKISFIIHLEMWDRKSEYERLGLDEETEQIIDVALPRVRLPIRPGRNLAILIEVATMNFRMKRTGVNAAEQFSERLTKKISNQKNEMNQE